MRFTKYVCLVLIPAAIFGCASIVEGTDQTLSFKIEPESANCEVSQKGKVIGSVGNGGGQLNVPKSKNDLSVACTAPGHKKQILNLESSASGWGIVGCFLIDLCITDYSTGALNKYDEVVSIRLPKDETSVASPVSAPPTYATSPAPPTLPVQWRTLHDRVRGYWGDAAQNQFFEMPRATPLTFVRQQGDWGLFQYTGHNGTTGQVWILMSEAERTS